MITLPSAIQSRLPVRSSQINITRGKLPLTERIKHGYVLSRNLYLALFFIKHKYIRM